MPVSITALKALVAAGATPDMIVAAVEAQQLADDKVVTEKRRKNAARMKRVRERARTSMHIDAQTRTDSATTPPIVTATETTTSPRRKPQGRARTFAHRKSETALSVSPKVKTINQGKEEKKERAKPNRGHRLPDDWQPTEQHFIQGAELGFSHPRVVDQAEDMRLWARSNEHRAVARKSDWDLTFSGWMRRNKPNGANSHGQIHNGRPARNGTGKRTVHEATDNLLERVRALAEPTPADLCGGTGKNPVRQLPPR